MEGKTQVAVVGGGLVGSLFASYLAHHDVNVDLFDLRPDSRLQEHVKGRSINLALSFRGLKALKITGSENILEEIKGIPMRGRMIHNNDGSKNIILYDPVHGQCIYSVGRKRLNDFLLTAAEKHDKVNLHFNHKLRSINIHSGELEFSRTADGDILKTKADVIIGADGAFSTVRKEFLKQPMFNYSQHYIEHAYIELHISSGSDGQFLMDPNYLHIWPRRTFMMIALPNCDASWTVTLFMPVNEFAKLESPDKLMKFFETYFFDAIDLIGKEKLIMDFFASKPSPLISVKGLEDCFILDELLRITDFNTEQAFLQFSKLRCLDGEAVCDLAMYNYVEMRDLVSRRSFIWRKHMDDLLHRLFPSFWIPLYSSVTFSDMRYSKCIANKQEQDRMLNAGLLVVLVLAVSILAAYFFT
ncbi:kynurenine 3-monooxygenase isoform X2 [Bemisia tabaci]|uniref:kynurenine 3-monooxygenase isoform X2 n=1 Tax=Bemisia tabaci TaxID=7038 RepID=UPI003B27B993